MSFCIWRWILIHALVLSLETTVAWKARDALHCMRRRDRSNDDWGSREGVAALLRETAMQLIMQTIREVVRGLEVAWFWRVEVSCYCSYFVLFLVTGLGFGFWHVIWGHFRAGGRPNLRKCMSIRQRIPPTYPKDTRVRYSLHGCGSTYYNFGLLWPPVLCGRYIAANIRPLDTYRCISTHYIH